MTEEEFFLDEGGHLRIYRGDPGDVHVVCQVDLVESQMLETAEGDDDLQDRVFDEDLEDKVWRMVRACVSAQGCPLHKEKQELQWHHLVAV